MQVHITTVAWQHTTRHADATAALRVCCCCSITVGDACLAGSQHNAWKWHSWRAAKGTGCVALVGCVYDHVDVKGDDMYTPMLASACFQQVNGQLPTAM